MENKKSRSGLLMAIRLIIAGYPVHEMDLYRNHRQTDYEQ